jgi:hypothetical protein
MAGVEDEADDAPNDIAYRPLSDRPVLADRNPTRPSGTVVTRVASVNPPQEDLPSASVRSQHKRKRKSTSRRESELRKKQKVSMATHHLDLEEGIGGTV